MTATKIQPGDDTHLTLLMAPHSLNFVTGADRAALLAYGRDVFAAARASQCLAQIEEPAGAAPAAVAGPADEREAFECLDAQNHHLRRAMQRVMARLTDLLDEDQFADIESIVSAAGVTPPAPALEAPAAPDLRQTRDKAGILHYLTPEQMAEEIVRLDARLAAAPQAPDEMSDAEAHQRHYRGNSVSYIKQKLDVYRGAIDRAFDVLRGAGHHPDGKTELAELIRAALAAAPQAPAAPSAIATQVIENLLQLARIVNTAVEDWGESFEDGSMEVTFHKEEADAMEAILEFFDSLPDAPPEEGVIESGPLRAARVLRALAAPAAPAVDAFTHAELLEIKRAVEEFADCNETDVDYALLLRAAQAGYLECTQFHVLNQSALDLDTVAAAQAKEGGA